jgi:hypothetical protein
MKKFNDDMRWKEASKVRKLKSQIRSRKMVESQRKRLGAYSEDTDYLHDRPGRVVTRRQIDDAREKPVGSAARERMRKE